MTLPAGITADDIGTVVTIESWFEGQKIKTRNTGYLESFTTVGSEGQSTEWVIRLSGGIRISPRYDGHSQPSPYTLNHRVIQLAGE